MFRLARDIAVGSEGGEIWIRIKALVYTWYAFSLRWSLQMFPTWGMPLMARSHFIFPRLRLVAMLLVWTTSITLLMHALAFSISFRSSCYGRVSATLAVVPRTVIPFLKKGAHTVQCPSTCVEFPEQTRPCAECGFPPTNDWNYNLKVSCFDNRQVDSYYTSHYTVTVTICLRPVGVIICQFLSAPCKMG